MHHNSNHEVKIVRPIEANNREMETIREIKPPRNVESAGCVCGFLVILYIAGKREREKNENFKKSSESKMSLVKVVANDSSYCSKFFLF